MNTGATANDSGCLAGRFAALKSGGFTGPLLCNGSAAKFNLVGKIVTKEGAFLIYDYRFKLKPKESAVFHGGQRLVLFKENGTYLGQYALNPPPQLNFVIVGSKVVANSGKEGKGTVELADGPPARAYLDGSIVTFFQ
jgi:hypothetical protein